MVGLVAVQAFSLVVASGDHPLVVVHRLLAVVAPLVAEHRLWAHKLQQGIMGSAVADPGL